MATDVENLMFKFLGDTKGLDPAVERTIAGLDRIAIKVGAVGAIMTRFWKQQINMALQAAGAIEQTTIAYETMLGSVEQANELMADLTRFAALTPFEMPEIQAAARGLVMFGERGDELMETLNILGNATAGVSGNFGELALIFNQIRGVGKLLTQDFRQLSTRGVISLQDIADHFDVTTQAAQKMLSSGKISFKDVRDILKGLSEEGGRFENLMEKQSQSFGGLMSTLSDNLNIFVAQIGKELLPAGKAVLDWMVKFTDYLTELPTEIKYVIAAIAGLGLAFGTLATAISGAIAAYTTFVGIMAIHGVTITAQTAMMYGFAASIKAVSAAWALAKIAVAGYVGYQIGKAIYNQSEAVKGLNRELQKSRDLQAGTMFHRENANQQQMNTIDSMFDDEEKVDAYTRAIAEAEKELGGLKMMQQLNKQAADQMAPTMLSLWQSGRAEWKAQEELVGNYNEKIEQTRQHIQNMRDAMGELTNEPFPDEETTENAKEYAAQLERQIRFFGMAKDEIMEIELEEKGITGELLKQIRMNHRILRQKEEEAKAAEDAKRKEMERIEEIARLRKKRDEEMERDRIKFLNEAHDEQMRLEEQARKEKEAKQKQLDAAMSRVRNSATQYFASRAFDITAQGLSFGSELASPEKKTEENTRKIEANTKAMLEIETKREPTLTLAIVENLV